MPSAVYLYTNTTTMDYTSDYGKDEFIINYIEFMTVVTDPLIYTLLSPTFLKRLKAACKCCNRVGKFHRLNGNIYNYNYDCTYM